MTEKSTKRVNYTDEQETFLRAAYVEHGTPKMPHIVALFNTAFDGADKSIKSIRGKIMTFVDAKGENIYMPIKKEAKPKVDKGPTKSDYLTDIAAIVGENFNVTDLENATKGGIIWVLELARENAALTGELEEALA